MKGNSSTKHYPAKAMPCGCTSEFQDLRYGKGMRLHNPTKGGDTMRCTVCGREQANTKTEKKAA